MLLSRKQYKYFARKCLPFLFLILIFQLNAFAQSAEKKEKEIRKKKEFQLKQQEKAMKEAHGRHLKIQDKEVRKRMKKSAREARRHHENKRRPFFVRWFKKRP